MIQDIDNIELYAKPGLQRCAQHLTLTLPPHLCLSTPIHLFSQRWQCMGRASLLVVRPL